MWPELLPPPTYPAILTGFSPWINLFWLKRIFDIKGEPIAAVAAQTQEIAMEALELIELKIEEQTPVFDVFEAMKQGAPKVRPEGNILQIGDKFCRRVVKGDIEKGFAEADEIIESEYIFPSQEHAPLEPQVSLAVPESDGRLTIYTVTQALYFHLKQMYRILGQGKDVSERWSKRMQYSYRGKMGYSDIKYVGGMVGGGFGGKSDLHADPIAALLALKTGKPCKWRWTREEETLCSSRHSPWILTIKDGVNKRRTDYCNGKQKPSMMPAHTPVQVPMWWISTAISWLDRTTSQCPG